MNSVHGIYLIAIGLLSILIGMIICFIGKNSFRKMLSICIILIITIITLFSGMAITIGCSFKCCETINFTDTCKICGYEYNAKDEWTCCDQINYEKYCTKCGKENELKKENTLKEEQYIYCCEKQYNIKNNNFCAVCGSALKTNNILNKETKK